MKTIPTIARFGLFAALLVAAPGCPPETADPGAVQTALEVKKEAIDTSAEIDAQGKVRGYLLKKGENPPSIEALEAEVGPLKRLPPGQVYRYNPADGAIQVVEGP
jgi:hypothetical protein